VSKTPKVTKFSQQEEYWKEQEREQSSSSSHEEVVRNKKEEDIGTHSEYARALLQQINQQSGLPPKASTSRKSAEPNLAPPKP